MDCLDVRSGSLYLFRMRTAQKSKPLPRGMKITLRGLRDTKDLRAMLHEAVDRLEAMGINRLRGVNLYVTPADENGEPLTRLGRDRLSGMTIVIENPYRAAADEYGA
jgi:hypothetical protein